MVERCVRDAEAAGSNPVASTKIRVFPKRVKLFKVLLLSYTADMHQNIKGANNMKAGFYEANITPPLGGYIWGSYAPHFGKDVDDELFAKALVVEDKGEIAAFVCIDSCSIPADMHDIVTKRIFEYTGITADRVCLSSNHTHKGATILDAGELGLYADQTFKDVCYRKTADAVILAYKRLKEVTVTFDTVQIPGIAHNRTSVMPDGTYRTWISNENIEAAKLSGEDNTYTVMTFKAEGKPIGSLSSFPVHQDTTNHEGFYSGDYSSALSANLKEKYGSDFVSLFLLGTCGDINHINHKFELRPEDFTYYHRIIGKKLAENAIPFIENSKNYVGEGVSVVKELVTFKKRVPDMDTILSDLSTIDIRCALSRRNYVYYLGTNLTDEVDLYLQCITIGDVCIHILPGEIFVDIGLNIKEKSPFEKCFVVENSNSYCGYVPKTSAFIGKNDLLYETSLAQHSCLAPEAGDLMISKSVELANNLKESK